MAIRKASEKVLREHVIELLNGRGAHTGFDDVVKTCQRNFAGLSLRAFPTPRGCCSNTFAWRSGTFSSSAAIANTSPLNGLRAIGLKRKLRRVKRPGIRAFNSSAKI